MLNLVRSQRPPQLKTSKGHTVIEWIETHCVYSIGRMQGQRVDLLGWQKDFILALFAQDPDRDRRWYRWALLGIPKKNGKTEMSAWLALYFFLADGEPGAWVGVGASSDQQADLVFGACKRIVEWSPALKAMCKVYDRHIESDFLPGNKLIRVTSGTGTNDGPSWHALILDELHEWSGDKGRKLWTVLTNGIGGRTEPVILQITTAGFDKETVCGEQYDMGKLTAADHEVDPRYLFWWYEPEDEDCDYKDETIWRQVNPSWGVAIPEPKLYLQDQSVKKTESEFRRYFLNQWVDSEDMWLPWGAWDECYAPNLELDESLPLYVGIDGALKRDTFAIVAYQPQPASGEIAEEIQALAEELGYELPNRITRDVVRAWIWQNPYPKGHTQWAEWRLNLEEPKALLRELREQFPEHATVSADDDYPIAGPMFAYDPYMMEMMASTLEDEGLNMVEVPQTDMRMCPASETMYEKVLTQTLAHNGDPIFKRQVHSAVPKIKDRGWRITRPTGSRQPIDALSALAMAVYTVYNAVTPDDDFDIW